MTLTPMKLSGESLPVRSNEDLLRSALHYSSKFIPLLKKNSKKTSGPSAPDKYAKSNNLVLDFVNACLCYLIAIDTKT